MQSVIAELLVLASCYVNDVFLSVLLILMTYHLISVNDVNLRC